MSLEVTTATIQEESSTQNTLSIPSQATISNVQEVEELRQCDNVTTTTTTTELPPSTIINTSQVDHPAESTSTNSSNSNSDETLFTCSSPKLITKRSSKKLIKSPSSPITMSFYASKFKTVGPSLQLIDEGLQDESELKCGGSVMHTSVPNSGLLSDAKSDDDLFMEMELKEINTNISATTKKDIILSPTAEEKEQHHKDESSTTQREQKRFSLEYLIGFIPRWTFQPNKQSEARDLLALERTQLAWVRTALSIIMIGIAVSKLLTSSSDSSEVKILMVSIGTIFVVLGLLIFIYSFIRFQYATRRLIAGMYVADLFAPPFMFIFGMVVCTLALALVFVN